MNSKTGRYASVSDMLRDVSDDQEFNKEFSEQVAKRSIVKRLFALRTARGVSQQAVADALGCSQSRVSKIENGLDADLKLGEIEAYAKALDCQVQMVVNKRRSSAVEEVKYHAVAIKSKLDALADLASGDRTMAHGVAGFFGEAFFNLLRILQQSAIKLGNNPDNDRPYVEIVVQTADLDDSGKEESADTDSKARVGS